MDIINQVCKDTILTRFTWEVSFVWDYSFTVTLCFGPIACSNVIDSFEGNISYQQNYDPDISIGGKNSPPVSEFRFCFDLTLFNFSVVAIYM